jgi:hypothetical protein
MPIIAPSKPTQPALISKQRWHASFLLLLLIMSYGWPVAATSAIAWSKQRSIVLSNTSTTNLGPTSILITLTPTTFDYVNANTDGSDLRFASSSAGSSFDLSHHIEQWDSNGTSRIWVRVPAIAAQSSRTIFMFYGNSAASSTADFAATFPNRLVSSGDLTLTGTQSYDWFELRAGHTLTLQQGQPLTITAQRIIIAGAIDGSGRGSSIGALPSTGEGIGGGSPSGASMPNAGAGGGSYGGSGGRGGQDLGDTPGQGGPTYGSSSGDDIAMGSAGGSSINSAGGNGGGALILDAPMITITGTITMNGQDAAIPGGSQGGGGGAGGGVLIRCFRLDATGTINANGGNGSTGTAATNDSGGGGGGGRIKIFAEQIDNTLITSVAGGSGGPYGSSSPGQNGQDGTIARITKDYAEVSVQLGGAITPGQLALEFQANQISATPGASVSYTLRFRNNAATTASNNVLTYLVPTTLTNTAVQSSGATISQRSGQRYIWDIANLLPEQQGVITITGTLASPLAAGQLSQMATLRGTIAGDETDIISAEATITVGNVAPVFAATPIYTAQRGQRLAFQVYASDANGDTLTYTLGDDSPPGVSIDSATGMVTWTPAMSSELGSYVIPLAVSDSATTPLSDTTSVIVQVRNPVIYLPLVERSP